MKQTLLVGNGVSRLINSAKLDWKTVLESTMDPDLLFLGDTEVKGHDSIPYTHMYEDILLNDKYKKSSLNSPDVKSIIKAHINDVVSSSSCKDFNKVAERLIKLDVNHLLTTNYEYTLAKVLEEQGFKDGESRQQTIYSTRRKHPYKNKDGRELDLWYIHGELNYLNSMMLGYDHYCGSIAKISDYMKNGRLSKDTKSELPSSVEQDNKPHFILKKLYAYRESGVFNFETWMDTFFLTDVHIIGLGLGFQEIDLWWLLNKRYRYIKDHRDIPERYHDVINNRIYYYGYVTENVKAVLDAYGVNTENAKVFDTDKDINWSEFYLHNIDIIEQNIAQRRGV